jgi:hypothetical protein
MVGHNLLRKNTHKNELKSNNCEVIDKIIPRRGYIN